MRLPGGQEPDQQAGLEVLLKTWRRADMVMIVSGKPSLGSSRENTSSTQVILAFVRLSVGRYEDLFSGKASPT